MINLKLLSLLLLSIISIHSFAQKQLLLKSNSPTLDIRDGNNLRKGRWSIDPKTKPDIYEAFIDKKYKRVTFISDIDSISFKVKAGKKYPFLVILNKKDTAYTQINGIKDIPAAEFRERYIASHNGKSFVEIPPIYELFNIVVALTNNAKKDEGLVVKHTPYYQELLLWFDKYKDEPIVKRIDSVLSQNLMGFVSLKMDAYAFDLSTNGKIVKGKIYNRINSGRFNTLKPYIEALQSFADKSKFKGFYRNNSRFYSHQLKTYKDSIGLQEMQKWLTQNFPTTRYNSFKVIFSPLVGNIQSAIWFENNGFKEAQAHVNFPYRDTNDEKEFSSKALNLKEGNIVFTELNHSFINPEAEKPQYQKAIINAFSDMTSWNEKGKPAALYYNTPYTCFNEYMNWGLVSLRYIDYAPAIEQEKLIAVVEKKQIEARGFKKFGIFNQYLIQIYKTREKGQTIADLYPLILKWFEENK